MKAIIEGPREGGRTFIRIFDQRIKGDKFENIRNSTIVNRSSVIGAFNNVETHTDEATVQALLQIAEAVEKSGNLAAASLFNEFSSELEKPEPDKTRLRQFWDGLVSVLPNIATLSEAINRVVALFTGA